jgi:flagellar basal body-associated protein FliL
VEETVGLADEVHDPNAIAASKKKETTSRELKKIGISADFLYMLRNIDTIETMPDETNPPFKPGSPADALAAANIPLPHPEKPTEVENPPAFVPLKRSILKNLRTYQGDVDDIVGKGEVTMTSIALAEQQRQSLRPDVAAAEQPTDQENIQHKIMLIVGGLLLILGIVTIGAVIYNSMQDKQQAKIAVSDALVAYAQKNDLPTASSTRADLLGQIISYRQSFKLPVNSILYLNTVGSAKTPMSVQDMMLLLAPQIPDALLRSFDPTYMIGVYSFDTNEPFIILTTSDFGSAYAGMLKWEATMPQDLARVFNLPKLAPGAAPYIFEDEAFKNKDLRVVKDADRHTVLLYSFIDRNTLVITSHENILTGLLGKFITAKMTR